MCQNSCLGKIKNKIRSSLAFCLHYIEKDKRTQLASRNMWKCLSILPIVHCQRLVGFFGIQTLKDLFLVWIEHCVFHHVEATCQQICASIFSLHVFPPVNPMPIIIHMVSILQVWWYCLQQTLLHVLKATETEGNLLRGVVQCAYECDVPVPQSQRFSSS